MCHAKIRLNACLDLWLGKDYRSREYRNRPLIEFATLPTNLQMLISKSKLRSLKLDSQGGNIEYVTPDMVLAQKVTLELMKRYLLHIDANRGHKNPESGQALL